MNCVSRQCWPGGWPADISDKGGRFPSAERRVRGNFRLTHYRMARSVTDAGIPVTLREYLTLMQALEADLASRRVEDFVRLSRALAVLVINRR